MSSKIAVIGAGIAGTNLASLLKKEGFQVSIFEKARGPGGRTSSRRANIKDGTQTLRLDHGAQYIDVSNPQFQEFIDGLIDLGVVVKHGDTNVAVPAMNAICKYLVQDIDAHYQVHIKETQKRDEKLELFDLDSNSLGLFDWIVSTAPPKQAADIFHNYALSHELKNIEMKAHFATMLVSEKDFTRDFESSNIQDSLLNWIGVLNRKPGRTTSPTQIIMHSNFKWTLEHAEADRSWVQEAMLAELEKQTGFKDERPLYLAVHRWLYGRTLEPFGKDFIIDEQNKFAICGDWLCGDDIQAAWLSSTALAKRLTSLGVVN